MNLLKRLLAASGGAGLLIALAGAIPTFAAGPSATIALACAAPGADQTITVYAPAGDLVHVEVTMNNSIVSATSLVSNSGVVTKTVSVPSVVTAATSTVRVWILSIDGVSEGSATFSSPTNGTVCATPSPTSPTFAIGLIQRLQVGGQVEKTCDAGLTGNAAFTATIQVNVVDSDIPSTTITLPADLTLTLTCNGESESLPKLPTTSVITFHESTAPAGAAVAADTKITIGNAPVTTTIHNAKAVVVTTPTPTPAPIVLPATGHPASTPGIPWTGLALLGLIAVTGAGLVLRRRS